MPRQKGVSRQRKIDKCALQAHVRDYPDALLRERGSPILVLGEQHGYSPTEHENHTQKKTLKYTSCASVRALGNERDPDKRMDDLQKLRRIVIECGSDNIVYIDKLVFEPEAYRVYKKS